jgi:hypothetical protein
MSAFMILLAEQELRHRTLKKSMAKEQPQHRIAKQEISTKFIHTAVLMLRSRMPQPIQ